MLWKQVGGKWDSKLNVKKELRKVLSSGPKFYFCTFNV